MTDSKILEKIAKVISAVSSPFIVLPIVGLLVIAQYTTVLRDLLGWGGIFLLSIILPFLYIFFEVRRGKITDVHIMKQEQRLKPFILITFSFLILTLVFMALAVPRALVALGVALTGMAALFTLITKFWKISIHTAGFTSAVVIMGLMIDSIWFWGLLVVPVVLWARLVRKRHTVSQGVLGMVLGGLVTYLLIALLSI